MADMQIDHKLLDILAEEVERELGGAPCTDANLIRDGAAVEISSTAALAALRRTQSEGAVRTEGVKDGWLKDDMERASASVEQWKAASLPQHAQSGAVEALPCKECGGEGLVPDYIGDDMKCVGVECQSCGGSGEATPSPAVAESELREFIISKLRHAADRDRWGETLEEVAEYYEAVTSEILAAMSRLRPTQTEKDNG